MILKQNPVVKAPKTTAAAAVYCSLEGEGKHIQLTMLNRLDATGPSLKPASSPLETPDPAAPFLLDCSRVILCNARSIIAGGWDGGGGVHQRICNVGKGGRGGGHTAHHRWKDDDCLTSGTFLSAGK